MAALLDTPSRVLRRVQQYEDMELPSLPSFHQDDLDDIESNHSYGSGTDLSRQYSFASSETNAYDEDNVLRTAFPGPSSEHPEHCLSHDELGMANDIVGSMSHGGSSYRYDHDASGSELPNHSIGKAGQVDQDTSQTPLPPRTVHPQAQSSGSADRLSQEGHLQSRIPSLSRSEVSATDNEATTPNGSDRSTTYDLKYNVSNHSVTIPDDIGIDQSSSSPSAISAFPTPSKAEAVTPVAIRYMDQPSTAARAAATPFGYNNMPLGDITPRFRNRSPLKTNTPSVDYSSTPRAQLDDKERRKSHVLSVLASASLPSRVRSRGTPHPLRRASVAPPTDSISEDVSDCNVVTGSPNDAQSADVSSLSIASSQDLATDRKGQLRYQRGNTSVPDILMSTGVATPGFNHNLENRPDAIKIQKHLNMMNKQLLDTNADLAREAEEWRQECTRLMGFLQEAGIDIEDGPAMELLQTVDNSLELPTLDDSFKADDVNDPPRRGSDHSQALRQELRKRDELILDLRSKLADGNGPGHVQRELEEAHRVHADLKTEFAKKTQEHVQQFTEICHDFEEQVKDLQSELETSRNEVASLQRPRSGQVSSSTSGVADRKSDDLAHDGIEDAQRQIVELVQSLDETRQASQASDAQIRSVSDALANATKENISLQDQKHSLEVQLAALEQAVTQQDVLLSGEKDRAHSLEAEAKSYQEEHAEAIRQLQRLHVELEDTRQTLAARDVDVQSLRNQLEVAQLENSFSHQSRNDPVGANNSLIAALEDRLDDAHREIGRLRHDLNEAPSHKAAIEACETRIKALEAEKATLADRLKARPPTTPGIWANSMMTSTPMAHKTVASLRGPKTPGPMKEFSWLQTTLGETNESFMRVQLDHLQQELSIVNSQLDKNFERLEAAGIGAVQLAEKLSKANQKIAELEETVLTLSRETQQSHAAAAVSDDVRNQRLEDALACLRDQMATLKESAVTERERLRDESRRLRELNSALQAKSEEEMAALWRETEEIRVESVKQLADHHARTDGLERMKAALEMDLQNAQEDVARLEKESRSSQRAACNHHDISEIVAKHQATITALKASLKAANDTVDTLRSEVVSRTHDWESALRTIESLKSDRHRMNKELAAFAHDLEEQREQCSSFGYDLRSLRRIQQITDSDHVQQVSRMEEELQTARQSLATTARQASEAQQRVISLDAKLSQNDHEIQNAAEKQRQKYRIQFRRLSSQIDYLKAKYTRENTFRNALALQKKFLLLLVGGMSLNEQATLRAIASMGLDVPAPPRPKRTFKAVAIAVLALVRARRASEHWQLVKHTKTAALAGRSDKARCAVV